MSTLIEELKDVEARTRQVLGDHRLALLLWRARIRIVALTEMMDEGR